MMALKFFMTYTLKYSAPEDWTRSAFIPNLKRGSTNKCQNFLISLVSHASKILLKVINQRLKSYLEPQISPKQAGFVKCKETRYQISNIRQLIEKAREFNTPMLLCFIHHKKAFWKNLWCVVEEMGAPTYLYLS